MASLVSASPGDGSGKKVALGLDEQLLLQELVHPIFADMPAVRLAWSFFGHKPGRPAEQSPQQWHHGRHAPPVVCSAVLWLARHMAAELKYRGRRRGRRWERAVSVPESQPAEVVLAALSLALYLEHVDEPLSILMRVPHRSDRKGIQRAWKDWQQRARSDIDAPHLEPLRARADGYGWVRKDTHPCSYLARLAAAFGTLRHGSLLGSVPSLLRGTQLLSTQCRRPQPHCNLTAMWHCDRPVLEVAAQRARQGFRVAAVSAASAYSVGGGFLSGGRHALEESMCMQSTLYFSLQRAAHLALECGIRDGQEQPLHIPEDGALLSPGVEVFRDGTDKGYALCSEGPVWLEAVLSVAMPNMNPAATDCPLDWHSKAQRELLIERKLYAVLHGAAMVDAEVLVIPDVGCGIYGNDPRMVGKAFGRVLNGYPGFFTEVIVSGSGSYLFFSAACEAAGSRYNLRCRTNLQLPENLKLCKSKCESVFSTAGDERDESGCGLHRLGAPLPCCGCVQGLRLLLRSLTSGHFY